jgi:DNA-binding SARP family transcriptional activator
VDVESFEAAAAMARRARDPASYRAAIDLYAGELLPEDRYETWVEDRREALRQAYLGLLLVFATPSEEGGDTESAISALGRVVAVEPTHEEARHPDVPLRQGRQTSRGHPRVRAAP